MNSENFTNRRKVITAALAGGASSLLPSWAMGAEKTNLPIAYGERELMSFPEKKPMIVLPSEYLLRKRQPKQHCPSPHCPIDRH